MKTFIVFPTYLAKMGGASYVKCGNKHSVIRLGNEDITVNTADCLPVLEDAFALADIATAAIRYSEQREAEFPTC